MANTFKNGANSSIGTVKTTVYTSPVSTTSVLIGLTLSNILNNTNIRADAIFYDSSADSEFYIIRNAPIAVGGALVAVGGNQKIILEPEDEIRVISDTASSVDAIVSTLQIT